MNLKFNKNLNLNKYCEIKNISQESNNGLMLAKIACEGKLNFSICTLKINLLHLITVCK